MALERLFRRNKPTRKEDDTSPAGLWLKCDSCHAQIYRKDLIANAYLCPECGFHHRMPVSARMQEGALSLMQMAKTTVALNALSEKRLPYIAVLTDPTTGGVTASFATLGDVIFAEPGALISFAGPRVIQQTIRQDLPEGFQRSEFLLQKGMVDDVVVRKELKGRIAAVLGLLTTGLPDRSVEAVHAATV